MTTEAVVCVFVPVITHPFGFCSFAPLAELDALLTVTILTGVENGLQGNKISGESWSSRLAGAHLSTNLVCFPLTEICFVPIRLFEVVAWVSTTCTATTLSPNFSSFGFTDLVTADVVLGMPGELPFNF